VKELEELKDIRLYDEGNKPNGYSIPIDKVVK
jgi:hypothetical protein